MDGATGMQLNFAVGARSSWGADGGLLPRLLPFGTPGGPLPRGRPAPETI